MTANAAVTVTDMKQDGFDARFLRNAFGCFASGITIVCCDVAGEVHGMTANSFVSVSLDPPLVLISVAQSARMHALIQQAKGFGVCVLHEEQEDVSDHFAARAGADYQPTFASKNGVPVLEEAMAWMACSHETSFSVGDHTLFVGRLMDCDYRQEVKPLLYFGGQYASLGTAQSI